MTTIRRHVWLSADLSGSTPPEEFRLFRRGVNVTTKGEFLFDDKAAASVMAAYQRQGVDLMIDLEHQSLGEPNRADSADARGWFRLELRDGDLWAVGVRWAPDGVRRLSEKTQRYTSPAFLADEENRIVEIVNCALVAMPATHNNAPLVAAHKRGCAPPKPGHAVGRTPHRAKRLTRMNPEDVKAALDALEKGDQAKALELLKNMIASAASGGAVSDPGVEATSDTAQTPPEEDPSAAELAALRADVERLSKSTTQAQSAELVKLRAEVKRLTDAADAIDQAERLVLAGELVKLGVEFPATVWEGDPEQRKLVARLQSEPLAGLRARVEQLRALRPASPNAEPPKAGEAPIVLSKSEKAYCDKHGLTPEQFAARKATAAKKA